MASRDMTKPRTSISEFRSQLSGQRGANYWRSLDELAQTTEFQELLHREFSQPLDDQQSGPTRRRFLQIMGASLALAGLNSCTAQPDELLVPYVKQPEELIPGKPLYFATAIEQYGGYAMGLLAESHMGRPTKIEGNPEHPASMGATDLFAQASILGLYDPDRTQAPEHLGRIRGWEAFDEAAAELLRAQEPLQGAGIRVLTGASSSPTFERLIGAMRTRFPRAQWHRYDAVDRDAARQASQDSFGEVVETRLDLSKADVLLSFDSDFLTQGPWHVRNAREFVERRRVLDNGNRMSRFWCIESSPSSTGTMADQHLARTPQQMELIALALAHELGVSGTQSTTLDAEDSLWVELVAGDLRASAAESAVIAGDSCTPALQTLVHAINQELGNVGRAVLHSAAVESEPVIQGESLAALSADMRAGTVDLLLVLGGNPAFDAPSDLGFATALDAVPLRVHLGAEANETSELCHWHLPESHALEAWGDLRAADGSASIIQPIILPLYQSRSRIELMASLFTEDAPSGRDLVQSTWRAQRGGPSFDKEWRRWLHAGRIDGTASSTSNRRVNNAAIASAATTLYQSATQTIAADTFTILFRPDPTLWDGRHANNGWLQECPKPLSKLTWDNAALIAPSDATRLGIENGDELRLSHEGNSVDVAMWVLPGHAEGCITLHLGSGRRKVGPVGKRSGFDVYPLRSAAARWTLNGVHAEATGERHKLASTQLHHNMMGRDIVRAGTLAEYRDDESFLQGHAHVDPNASLMPGFEYEGNKWGLAVDLSACSGCNACVIACQAENNVPVVGKEEVLLGRELSWLRIDRYYEGELDDPATMNQPVMCMHCEQAPCEVVCPVGATVHSDEGLNDMVYNRCVGTRYCSNNCPYKVRRFNYYQYADKKSETLKMQRNPDVTVRNRGVMEKCSYCVQRINQARIEAKVEDLPLGDGNVIVACQQACPTQAILFGDLNDETSAVRKWKDSQLDYGLLEELGTRPRTSYLAKLRNPHPRLSVPNDQHADDHAPESSAVETGGEHDAH